MLGISRYVKGKCTFVSMSCNLAVNFSLCYLCCGFHSGQVICREPLPCWLKVILCCHQEIRKNNGTRLASPFSLLFCSKILTLLFYFFSLFKASFKKKKKPHNFLSKMKGWGRGCRAISIPHMLKRFFKCI